MESSANFITSNTRSMCCSDMMKRGDSLGTGNMRQTSTTSHFSSSLYQVNQTIDSTASISFSGEHDFGLPQIPQRVRIDFTPNEEDTEFVQEKCCAFWEFIHSRKDLQWMRVSPTPDRYPFQQENATEISSTSAFPSAPSTKKSKFIPVEKTALSMLQLAKERGVVDQALDPKFCGSSCRIGSPPLSGHGEDIPVPFETLKRRVSKKSFSLPSTKELKSSSKATTLCKEMDNWDKLHPKSMEPPSHAPPLTHAVLQ